MAWKRYFIAAILIVVAVFIVQNATMVEVRFLFWRAEAPRVLVLSATFALGMTTGLLLAWRRKK
ncbi:MAG: LapA family protein [Desulfobacterales bacterium]|jgi:uncharacterized integral membrane protein